MLVDNEWNPLIYHKAEKIYIYYNSKKKGKSQQKGVSDSIYLRDKCLTISKSKKGKYSGTCWEIPLGYWPPVVYWNANETGKNVLHTYIYIIRQ